MSRKQPIRAVIERSSLGTRDAVAARRRTPPAVRKRIVNEVERRREFSAVRRLRPTQPGTQTPVDTPRRPTWLTDEQDPTKGPTSPPPVAAHSPGTGTTTDRGARSAVTPASRGGGDDYDSHDPPH